jgi:glyoxylase-like metal-dependent hydrolase (beta-lactamase superfamily II)
MNFSKNRRQLLSGAMALSLAPALPMIGKQAIAASADGVEQLNEQFYLLNQSGANVLVRAGNSGNLMVDTGPMGQAAALIEQIGAATGNTNVEIAFNTHYHADQTGGNEALKASGSRIIAHKRTKEWMEQPNWSFEELRYSQARSEEALPTETFRLNGALNFSGEEVEYGYLIAAHSSGDIYVKFNNANIMAVGDVVSPVRDPMLEHAAGAWIGGRKEAMDKLVELSDENTMIIPAYGPVLTRAHLEAERDMMSYIYDETVEMVRKGFGPEEMLESGFMDNLLRDFDDPQTFLYDLCKGFWAHHNKLNHNVV